MIDAEKAREWLGLLEETPSWLAREAIVQALRTVIAQAEQIERVRTLHTERQIHSRAGMSVYCWACNDPYPCPTIAALDGAS